MFVYPTNLPFTRLLFVFCLWTWPNSTIEMDEDSDFIPRLTITDSNGEQVPVMLFPMPVSESRIVPPWEFFPAPEPEPESTFGKSTSLYLWNEADI